MNRKSIVFGIITSFIIIIYMAVNMTANIQKMGSIKGMEEIVADIIILAVVIGVIYIIIQKKSRRY